MRVIAYIDGFNFYFGLKEMKWNYYLWLNYQSLMQKYLEPGQTLICTKYFTSIINFPKDKHDRQNSYLEALQTLDNFTIQYGHFYSNDFKCYNCGDVRIVYHEKMTDVNIATEMLVDSFNDKFDVAILVTADSDLVGPIKNNQTPFSSKRSLHTFSSWKIFKGNNWMCP